MLALDKNRMRPGIQALAALIQNANFRGFFTGRIYTGKLKSVCVPGLNCYSCPGAVGACPIGSLQNTIGSYRFRFPYYVLGLLIFFGAVLGRAVCGFLCPFGLLQDIIYKIPFFKKNRFKLDKYLRDIKYGVMAVLVIILPVTVKLTPFFCKYVCPSGTVSGILLAIADSRIMRSLGPLFTWKFIVLMIFVVGGLMVFRPFCKYICPLGAIYGFFNKIALYRLKVDLDKCVGCGKCIEACLMNVDPVKTPDSPECIRCGKCAVACPKGAICTGLKGREKKKSLEDPA